MEHDKHIVCLDIPGLHPGLHLRVPHPQQVLQHSVPRQPEHHQETQLILRASHHSRYLCPGMGGE